MTKVDISSAKFCIMGYSSFMYDIVAALSNASAKIVSVVTHINEAGLIGDYESSLAQRGLYYSMTDVIKIAIGPPKTIPIVAVKNIINALGPNRIIPFKSVLKVIKINDAGRK